MTGAERVLLPRTLNLHARTGHAGSVVLLHGVGGSIRFMMPVADALQLPVHVYLVQAPGLLPGESPLDAVAPMCERYAALLTALDAPAPLMLCGYSFGGVVALETTRLLRAAGTACKPPVLLAPTANVRSLQAPPVRPDARKVAESVDKLMRGFQAREGVALDAAQARRFRAVYRAHLLAGMRHHCARGAEDLVLVLPDNEPKHVTARAYAAWACVCSGHLAAWSCQGAHENIACAAQLPRLLARAFLSLPGSTLPKDPGSPA